MLLNSCDSPMASEQLENAMNAPLNDFPWESVTVSADRYQQPGSVGDMYVWKGAVDGEHD